MRVMERTQEIHSMDELEAAFTLAGDNLVMVAIESEEECTISDDAWSKLAGGTGSTAGAYTRSLLSSTSALCMGQGVRVGVA